jgi:hypothetical protein
MEMDFCTDPGTMTVSMIKYLQKIMKDFLETLRGTKESPARNNVFEIRKKRTESYCLKSRLVSFIAP